MTKVVLATESADGTVRMYVGDPTVNGMDQTGQFRSARPIDPTALANLSVELSNQLGWMDEPAPVAPKVKAKAVPAPKPKALPAKTKPGPKAGAHRNSHVKRDDYRVAYHPDEPPPNERIKMIIDYVTEHPDSDMATVIVGCGLEADKERRARWHHHFTLLVTMKVLAFTMAANQRTKLYRIAGTT